MIETYKLKAKMADLNLYDYLAKKGDYIEVCEWNNGEGVNVEIGGKEVRTINLTHGEMRALMALYFYEEKSDAEQKN